MTGMESRPELADAGRLARKLIQRAVRTARSEDQPLRRVLIDHLGPDAAALPTVSDNCPPYEHVNLQVGVDEWLAASPRRTHEIVGIAGVGMLRHSDVTIGDLLQEGLHSHYGHAGIGAPVMSNLSCGPDGQTRACVSNGIYLIRDGDDRLVIMFLPTVMGPQAEVSLQIMGTDQTVRRYLLGTFCPGPSVLMGTHETSSCCARRGLAHAGSRRRGLHVIRKSRHVAR
jgi:hypothetical protein